MTNLNIAMLSIHSSPLGELGKRNNGGMSVYIIELSAELEKLGHRIDIFTLRRPHNSERTVLLGRRTRLVHLDIGDIQGLSKPRIHSRLESFFGALEDFCSEEQLAYDLVHSHYWLSGQVGQWARQRWRVPHLVTFHSLGMVKKQVLNFPSEPDLRIEVEKELAHACDCIVVPTRRELENMADYYAAPRQKMALIPCGVNLARFRPLDREPVRSRLNLPADASILLYVGRFTSEKGLDRLLRAVPLIRPDLNPHLVIIGGDGPGDEATLDISRTAREMGIVDQVHFAGRIPQDKLPMYYNAADLMVLPSLYESFGLVALESLACGTPVVSTPVGAVEHIILQGKTGEVVKDPGPQALAEGINSVLADSRKEEITKEAVRASVKNFGWANIASAMSREYTRLVNERKNGIERGIHNSTAVPATN